MKNYKLDFERYAVLARQATAEGCVLLENEGQALPLREGERVAVFGRMAFHYYKSGLGSGGLVNTRYVVGILDALKDCKEIRLEDIQLLDLVNTRAGYAVRLRLCTNLIKKRFALLFGELLAVVDPFDNSALVKDHRCCEYVACKRSPACLVYSTDSSALGTESAVKSEQVGFFLTHQSELHRLICRAFRG